MPLAFFRMRSRLRPALFFATCAIVAPLGFAKDAPAQPIPTLKPIPPTPPPIKLLPNAPNVPASKGQLLIGTGISDITGPAAEVGMMGYGKSDQITSGIQTRLWARAYVIANPTTNKRIVFVSAELGQLFSSLKQGVLRKLAASFGTLYDDKNVQISATHTHSGPGGYSHHLMYNVTSKGFIQQNYDAIVNGITAAIAQAHSRTEPGNITIAKGDLTDISVQRAREAWLNDPDSPKPEINPTMTVVRLNRAIGQPKGAISWFSIHNASVSRFNTLISSDNKGHAALLFEKAKGTIMPFVVPAGFVAAFPNGDEGDISPNTGPSFTGPGGRTEFDSAAYTGERQYQKADQLFNSATEDLGSEIDFRHTFVNMPALALTNASGPGVGGRIPTPCSGAYGMSFAAGAKDGPTAMAPFREGMKVGQGNVPIVAEARRFATNILLGTDGSRVADAMWTDPCQAPKPILIPGGALGITPNILPFQILRIGSLAILGVPGEMTSMAGRRITTKVAATLAPKGVSRVIITGLANEYSGYITTPEEYDAQLYEGASTIYGRMTFDAYLQIFQGLARDMVAGQASPAGPTPPDLSRTQLTLQTPVVLDTVKAGETMGQVIVEPPAVNASNGERPIVARFRAGHPKNNLRSNDTYLFVEKKNGAAWERVAWDAMPETLFTWTRDGGATSSVSYVETSWMPPVGTTGTFRIKHFGSAMTAIGGPIRPYEGVTREFEVRAEPAQCKTLRQQERTLTDQIASIQRSLAGLGGQQKDCQAGRGDSAGQGGRKPGQCVDGDDKAAKTALQNQSNQANGQLATVRSQKSSAGCVY